MLCFILPSLLLDNSFPFHLILHVNYYSNSHFIMNKNESIPNEFAECPLKKNLYFSLNIFFLTYIDHLT